MYDAPMNSDWWLWLFLALGALGLFLSGVTSLLRFLQY